MLNQFLGVQIRYAPKTLAIKKDSDVETKTPTCPGGRGWQPRDLLRPQHLGGGGRVHGPGWRDEAISRAGGLFKNVNVLPTQVRRLLTNCTYLEDDALEVMKLSS